MAAYGEDTSSLRNGALNTNFGYQLNSENNPGGPLPHNFVGADPMFMGSSGDQAS